MKDLYPKLGKTMTAETVKKLCKKYLNSEITLSEYSLFLENTKPLNNPEKDELINNLIDFAAYTISRNLTEQDKKDGYKTEAELKAKINDFLKKF